MDYERVNTLKRTSVISILILYNVHVAYTITKALLHIIISEDELKVARTVIRPTGEQPPTPAAMMSMVRVMSVCVPNHNRLSRWLSVGRSVAYNKTKHEAARTKRKLFDTNLIPVPVYLIGLNTIF